MSAALTLIQVSFSCNAILVPSSHCFTNHKSLLPPFNNLSNQKLNPYCFRIFSLSTHPQGTTAPVTTTTTARKSVAVYLIERLGFSEEDSLAVSKKLLRQRDNPNAKQVTDLISYENADYVITFLQEHCGFDQSQVKKVITKHPTVLAAKVDKTLKPKIKLLQDLGFSTSDLALVLHANPRLYLEGDLSPAIQALRGIMGSDEGVVRVFKRLRGSTSGIINNLIPNVTMLENEYGIPRDKLRKFMCVNPGMLAWHNETALRDLLVKIEEDKWGISRDSVEFLRAVHVFYSLSDENINTKCQVFKSFGWSESDIMSLIRQFPYCLTISAATMKKKLEFYMNEMGYKPAYMLSLIPLFTYSLENRVLPRHRVVLILKEKGLIKADLHLLTAILPREDEFLSRFILRFKQEIPKLHEVYINCKGNPKAPLHMETSLLLNDGF